MEHAIRNASRKNVKRVAHSVIVATKEWLDKPAYEKSESLDRATTSLAADAAMGVLTEGLGTLGTLRKVERTAEAADHVRDVERVARSVDRIEETGKLRGILPERGGPTGHIWPHEVIDKTPAEIDLRARQLGLTP